MAKRSSPYVTRLLRAHPRIFLSILLSLGVAAALPDWLRLATRLLLGWDSGIILYLLMAYALMLRSTGVRDIRQRAAKEDEGRFGILVLCAAAALASIAAIIAEFGATPVVAGRQGQVTLALLTIPLSWVFVHTIFALHYAHEYYDENGGQGGGLVFPGGEDPDYWDFVYFAFVVGMTSQVSDVAVTCKPIRRTVAAHGVLSFIFNTALLALTINIAASII